MYWMSSCPVSPWTQMFFSQPQSHSLDFLWSILLCVKLPPKSWVLIPSNSAHPLSTTSHVLLFPNGSTEKKRRCRKCKISKFIVYRWLPVWTITTKLLLWIYFLNLYKLATCYSPATPFNSYVVKNASYFIPNLLFSCTLLWLFWYGTCRELRRFVSNWKRNPHLNIH